MRITCFIRDDGQRASATELAAAGSVGASTANAHLAKLVDAGLLVVEPRGRHRYFRLADAEVAHALEALALVAERGTIEHEWERPDRRGRRGARRCHACLEGSERRDHLAGPLAMRLLDPLLERGWLRPSAAARRALDVAPTGRQKLLPALAQ